MVYKGISTHDTTNILQPAPSQLLPKRPQFFIAYYLPVEPPR